MLRKLEETVVKEVEGNKKKVSFKILLLSVTIFSFITEWNKQKK
jgi:hypothetical protein